MLFAVNGCLEKPGYGMGWVLKMASLRQILVSSSLDQASRSCPTRRIDAREAVSLPATRSCASPGAGHAGGNEHAEASGAGEVREAKSIHRIHLTF
jgi:hypothetical protein